MNSDLFVIMTVPGIDLRAGGPSKSVTSLAHDISTYASVSLYALDSGQPLIITPSDNPLFELVLYPSDNIWRKISAKKKMTSELTKRALGTKNCILHSHGIWCGVNQLTAKAARVSQTPFVVSARGMLEPWAMNYKKRKKQVAWALYQKHDLQTAYLLHATATQEAENLRNLGLKQPIAVIPNGVNIPNFSSSGKEKKFKKTALFLSRIHPKKGLLNLVEAWKKINNGEWRVVIAGPDESGHLKDVQGCVEKNKLSESFEFIGPVYGEKKWELYNSADLFVLPSFSENFGIVIAEALAAGVPVITTKTTPWVELETHNCGWWIDTGIDPLVDAILEAVSLSDEQRHQMGQRGRKLVEKFYSWQKIAMDMVAAYEWVLGGGAPPSFIITD